MYKNSNFNRNIKVQNRLKPLSGASSDDFFKIIALKYPSSRPFCLFPVICRVKRGPLLVKIAPKNHRPAYSVTGRTDRPPLRSILAHSNPFEVKYK
jgi:hypothetical protein